MTRSLAHGALALTFLLATAGTARDGRAAPSGWPGWADAVVAADGSGQFRSVQDAVFAAPTARSGKPWIIYVKAGTYRERLYVQREKRFVALVGEDAATTVIAYDLHANLPGPDGKPIGTFRTPTVQVDADDFSFENLTLENTAGPVGQALAVRVDGDRVSFRRCRFVGWQDTLLVNRGRQYFEDCFVSGHVDFIFGGAAAFFERCTIVARGDGYLTAASTPQEQRHGLVFSHCRIRGETPEVRTYLGRPWRIYGSTVFLDTEMSEAVRPEGWNNWRIDREKTARYAEHGNTGPGARGDRRVPWARRLSDAEAAALSARAVLAADDGWDPAAAGSVVPAEASAAPPPDTSSGCEPPARFTRGIAYAAPAGGARLALDACVPAGPGPFPAALLVHGGGWTGGDRTQAARPLRARLTKAGIAWLAVQYRLAPAVRYPAPVDDVVAAVRFVQRETRRLRLDPQRLALVGESAGGHLVVDAAVRLADDAAPRPAAVVAFFAPVDLEADADRRGGLSASMRALFGRTELDEAARRELRVASPLHRVRAGLPPFLLPHGTADMSVPQDQSLRLQKALQETGVPCELLSVPDGAHGTRGWDERLPGWADQVSAWLSARLAPRAPAAAFPVAVRVDARADRGELAPIWRFFGFDEPNFAYMKDGQRLLGELAALGAPPVYVRTHHLLTSGSGAPALKWGSTNVYREDAQGRPVYDWTIVDRIFDTLVARGLRPFVEIGFMPEALSTRPDLYPHDPPRNERAPVDGGQAYPPRDYDKWRALCEEWVRHCVERYGRAAVESWRFEVWNEPNILYWKGTPEEYHKLYDYAADGVRRALPTARVGGPHTAGGAGGSFLHDFLEHCLRGRNHATGAIGAPLDFVAFHAKGAPRFEDGRVRMGLAEQLRTTDGGFATVAAFPELRRLPIVIGEFDPEGCAACQGPQLGYRNGTMYSSYTAASFARLPELAARHGVRLEGALTWAFEFEDQPFFAGFRVLSTNGVDLPVLNAFRLLGRMGARRLAVTSSAEAGLDAVLRDGVRGQPDVSALASLDNGRLSVLLWHYHDDDEAGPQADVTLSLEGLPWPAGRAFVREYRVDREHGNAFERWKAMGSPQPPTAEQHAALVSAARLAPLSSPRTLELQAGRAELRLALPRQALSLVVIQTKEFEEER